MAWANSPFSKSKLLELRRPPIDLNAALNGAAGNAVRGILGAALGESPSQTAARVEEAKKTATDLTGLVRKKKAPDAPPEPAKTNGSPASANGKRKADELEPDAPESKKARVEGDAVGA